MVKIFWSAGRAAKNWSFVSPKDAARSIKRKMGQLDFRLQLGPYSMSPVEVSAEILRYVTHTAAKKIGEAVKTVVITVPAWFGDEQRRATLAAGEAAGLDVIRIINEPTAAALSYQSPQQDGEVKSELWMVYDLGGGTFDVSILNVKGEYKEVLASAGNTFLGGDDFDRLLALHLTQVIRDRFNVDPVEDEVAMAQLRHCAEEAKIALSTEPEHHIQKVISISGQSHPLDIVISREEFTRLIDELIESTILKVHQALDDAKVKSTELDRLVLVGGSTRIPMVQERLQSEFGLSPELYIDPDLSVAFGAGIQAALATGQSYQQIVVDVCPHTLGMAALGAQDLDYSPDLEVPLTFVPLIRRNSRLPAKMTRSFSKVFPDQRRVEIVVFQGESARTTDNQLIGRFMCHLPPTDKMDFFVTFSYDANGIIQIGVTQTYGQKALKNFTMDTGKSSSWNSEPSQQLDGHDDFDAADTWATPVEPSHQVSNYLIERVQNQLLQSEIRNHHQISEMLEAYRASLAAEDDDAMDLLESKLYDWLESHSQEAAQHGPQ
jgi:molecular chaperone DnaK